jgi:hypothetical protein
MASLAPARAHSTVRARGGPRAAASNGCLRSDGASRPEYLRYDLGTSSFASAPASGFFFAPVNQNVLYSTRFEGNVVRAGLNYHF